MSEIPSLPEKISERKIIVYKSRVDPTVVKLTAEKMKYKLFAKFGFSKSRAEEIRVVSVDKYYEPYVLVDAKYSVRYFKKQVFSFGVGSETDEVKISGVSYVPKVEEDTESGLSRKVIRLEAELWSLYRDKAYLVFDREGREIAPSLVPAAPSEDHPEEILAEFNKKAGVDEVSSQREIDLVKARIVKRPSGVVKVKDELFHVLEQAVIYSPIYEITFRNVRTGEEKLVKIDGVTAKIIS
ncbi:MAG: hypothetical protein NWF06_10530 [Candidatus Bathyarchaeota archaeon]|nr:hypothetical protein [Candidatus Bathyarchaeum sp.]